ncbi:signal peptidase II [Ruminococcus sp.]|uniref:signal peptidase II n=1 Tax=Ruminococcus sp. TaxID=41978 RepID=UPI0025DE6B83|nr:signal peptidase II [Ruminococcus sp.]
MEKKEFLLKHYLVFFIMPLSSLLYYIKNIKSIERGLGFLIYVVISVMFMCLLWKAVSFIGARFDIKKLSVTAVTAAVLVILDQLIKLALSKTGFETKIISKLFMIKQTHNINQTGLFNFLNIEITQAHAIVFKTVLLAVILCFYRLCRSETSRMGLTLLVAGAAANILDSTFYGYTLDYIHFYRTVTYDLKDYYVDAGFSVLILCFIKYGDKKKKQDP